jgi:PST family polysaccharide transporter
MARLGSQVTVSGLLNFCVRNIDSVLLGRFSGATAAGLYDRSYRLMIMPLEAIKGPIFRILFPILTRVRYEPVRYRRIYCLSIRGAMFLITPSVAVAAMLSDRLMPWLLGSQWKAAGPIFFWLGMTGLIQPIVALTGVLFISTGRGKAMIRLSIFSAIVTTVACVVGVQWGALGVAMALFFSSLLRLPIAFWMSAADTPVKTGDMYSAQIEPLIGACAVAIVFRLMGEEQPFFPVFIAAITLAYPAAYLTSCITSGGRAHSLELGRFVFTQLNNRLRMG